jgi:hypothetical protein
MLEEEEKENDLGWATEWKQQGIEEGLRVGKAEVLMLLLAFRFGKADMPDESGEPTSEQWLNKSVYFSTFQDTPSSIEPPLFEPLNDLEDILLNIGHIYEEMKKYWNRRGFEEGVKLGWAQLLTRLLTKRFSAVPPELQARIDQASQVQMALWLIDLLDAQSIEEVFRSG